MAAVTFLALIGANPTASVLDNLKTSSAALKATLSDTLNSALKSQLSATLRSANLPVLSGLIDKIPAVDLVAANSLSIQALLKGQLKRIVAKDPAMRKAVGGEIAKVSDATTIGTLLQLDTPLQNHPLLQVDVRKANIAALLVTSPTIGTNQQLQADFISRYAASTGSIQDFWQQLSSDPEFNAAVPELQFTLQLGTVTLNNVPLVATLRQKYQPKILRDLTARTAADWTQLVASNNISIPDSVSGSTAAEKTTNYVSGIIRSLQATFPTDYIAQKLAQAPKDDIDWQVAEFLNKSRDFDLITTSLQKHFEKNPNALPDLPAHDKNKLVARISGYQRLTRLNSDPQVVTALMGRGLDSAYKISSMPRNAFLQQHTQSLGSSANALTVYATAQRTTASTLNLYTTIREGLSNNHPWVFGDVSKEVSGAVQQIPDWEELFGSTSFCACQDCRSVLSAAAYLADLLHYLSKRQSDPTNLGSPTLLDVLSRRRPDLVNIKLNCENTNTTLPYLDLVNEILETVVVTNTGSTSNGLLFTVGTAPMISFLLPSEGPVGTSVAIYGGNFGAAQGASTVTFNGTVATPSSWNNTTIVVPVPAGSTTGNVVATVSGAASNGVLFTVGTAPMIAFLLPPTGPIGTRVEILGGNFGATQGTSTITFNGKPVTPTGWSETAILVRQLPGGITTGNVVVTVGGTASNGVLFTVGTAPMISLLIPPEGPVGTSVVIAGGNLGAAQGNSIVTFGGIPATATAWSNLEIVVIAPSGTSTGNVVVTVGRQSPTPVAYNTPPDATSGELGVNPEHTNDAAYIPLELAFHPFSLPFDRFQRTARNCLEFGGSSLYEVMRTLQLGPDPIVQGNSAPNPSPSDLNIALEYLKIEPAEFLILTGQPFQGTSPLTNPSDLAKYYGYNPPLAPSNWYSDLAAVPTFLRRTGISFDDLVSLLETHFLNPSQAMKLQANNPQNSCDIESTIIVSLTPQTDVNIDYRNLQKIYRFIRLYTKLGWSISDLDKAISALGATDIDEVFLLKLSHVRQLQNKLNLSPTEIFGLWANLDTDGPDSLYISLFQNKGTANPVDPAFALVYTSTMPYVLDLSFLNAYGAQVTYAGGQLSFSGNNGQPMTLHQERFLLSLSTDANYQRAVQQLFLGNPALLGSLPAGLTLPSRLPDAIYYQGNQLFFIGQMSDDLRAQLKGLSTDPNYQVAIDNLYSMRWAPGTEVALANMPIASHSNTILAGLRMSAADLTTLLTAVWGQSASPQLNIANLSALYRYAKLARTLNVSVQDLISLIELIGISPFPSWNNTQIVVRVPLGATTGNVVVSVGGTVSNGVPFEVGKTPQVFSLSPDKGMSGSSVTIAGVNFGTSQGLSSVTINGAPATPTSWNNTQITVIVPNLGGTPPPIGGGGGSVPVSLVVAVGGTPSNVMTFQVILTPGVSSGSSVVAAVSEAPLISTLYPVAGPVGTFVVITGANFGAAQGTSIVTFNGIATLPVSWSDTQIVVPVPAGATTGNVLVTVGGNASNALSFTVGTAPLISSLSPTTSPIGASVTITGANFGAIQGTSSITFNGTPATPVAPNMTVLFVGKVLEVLQSKFSVAQLNYIYRNISSQSAGLGLQQSDLDQLVSSLQSSLMVQPPETGSATDPTGTLLLQYLEKVLTSADVFQTLKLINGMSTWWAPLSALPPITLPADLSGLIAFNAATSQLTSKGPLSPGQEAELLPLSNASSYQAAIQGLLQQSAAAWATVYKSQKSATPLPAISFPTGFNGRSSNGVFFTVGTTPVVTSVSPSAGAAGATVTIAGVNFGAAQGTSTVTFNGTVATPTSWSDTQIVVNIPAGAGTGNVVITVGGNASNGVPFTVAATPLVFSLSPTAGPVGAAVTIAGVNFGVAQGTSTVTFNGTVATPTSWSNTQIVVNVPAGAGTGDVIVTVGTAPSNGLLFTVATTPVVSSVSPTAAPTGASVTILGSNFGMAQATGVVTFNGTPAIVTSWSSSQIVATVPASATTGNMVVTIGSLIAMDPTNSLILFLGPMSADQQTQLLALSSDPNYQAAIQNVYQQSLPAWSVLYTQPLNTLPFITLSSLSSGSIRFDATNARLILTGSMSNADEALLLSLSPDSSYRAAVVNLYAQPRQFIVGRLFFLDAKTLIAKLIDGPSLPQADKFGFVLNAFLNAVDVVIQTLSDNLNLDTTLTRLLVLGGLDSSSPALLQSTIDPGLAAIADFFAIIGNGLSASYYPSLNFTGAPLATRIDPVIDFNWGPNFPPVPGLDPAAFSAKWSGQVAAQFNETYTFYAQVSAASSPPSGTVTTNGTAVTWVSGVPFDVSWAGSIININGVAYGIQSVGGPKSLTLASAAGTQTSAVRFYVAPVTLTVGGTILTLTLSPATSSGPASGAAGAAKIEYTATVDLVAEELNQIELGYPNIAGCTITGLRLSWSNLSTAKTVVLQSNFFSDLSFTFDQPLATYKLLCRVALLLSTFRATRDDLIYLSNDPNGFQGINPNNPTNTVPFDLNHLPSLASAYSPSLFNQWERLLALFTLRDSIPGGDSGLLTIFQAAQTNSTQPVTALIDLIIAATGWDATNIGALVGSQSDSLTTGTIGFGLVAGDFTDERWLVRLQSCFALIARFGVSSAQLFEWASLGSSPSGTVTTNGTAVTWSSGALFSSTWATATIHINGVAYSIQTIGSSTSLTLASPAGVQNTAVSFYVSGFASSFEPNIARDIQSAIKARYDDATWLKVGKSLNDKLRVDSRDALVAFILANAEHWAFGVEMATPEELYEYFLIDVEMGSCMLTSRVVQANAAIQLFVQRCLLNLEPGISPSAIDPDVWEWMKNYRVWQANREVFLYPENFIDPTLRDDKTQFFRELEIELQQNPVTSDTAEQALMNYLGKLNQAGWLDVRGICWQYNPNSNLLRGGAVDVANDVLHVFARTPSSPYLYFYRRLLNASQYGHLESPSIWSSWETIDVAIQGDHLIPVVWDSHPYVFWPVFTESSSPQASSTPSLPSKTVQLQMAWSEYRNGKWMAKQVSEESLRIIFPSGSPGYQGPLDTTVFSFSTGFTPTGDLIIAVWTPVWGGPGEPTTYYNPDVALGTPGYPGIRDQLMAVYEGEFDFSDSGGRIAIKTFAEPSPFTGANPDIPPNSDYVSNILLEVNPGDFFVPSDTTPVRKLTLPIQNSAGQIVNQVVLKNTMSRYRVVCGKSGFDITSESGVGLVIQGFKAFFYSDDQRVYFVTPQGGSSPIPSFSAFWHPTVPAFIRTLNQYGIAGLFSLLTQQTTVDGGILSGFTLSTSNTLTPGVTGGTLYAQGQLYQTPPGNTPNVPALPLGVYHALLWCGPTGNFYYTPEPSPLGSQALGDAYIGEVFTDANQQAIVQVLPPGNTWTQTLIFEHYVPTYVLGPYPRENVDFSYAGAYSTYNWELFFHIPLLIATRLSQNQQFAEAQKWFHYIFNPTTNSNEPVPERFWNCLPFYECSVSDEINGPIETLLAQLDIPTIFYVSPVSAPIGHPVTITGTNFGATQGTSTVTFNGTLASPASWSSTQIVVNVPSGATSGNVVVTVGGVASSGMLFTVGLLGGIPQPSDCGADIGSQVSQWTQNPFDPFAIARLRTIAFRKTVVMKYLDNLIAWGDYLFSQNEQKSISEATQVYVLAQQILGDRPVIIPPQGTVADYSYDDLLNQARAEGLTDIDDLSNVLVQLESTFPFSGNISAPIAGGGGTATLNGSATRSFYFCIPPNDQLMGYWDTVADRLYKIRHCMNIEGEVEQLPLFAPPISPMLLVRAAARGVDLSSVLNDISAPTPNYRFSFMLQKAMELCAEVRSLGASLLSALEKNDAEGLSLLRATQESNLLKAVLQIKQSQVDEANDNLAALKASQAVTTNRQQYYAQLIKTGFSSFETTQVTELTQAQIFQQRSQTLELESGLMALIPNFTIGAEGISSPVATVTFGGIDLQAVFAAESRAMNMLSSFHSYCANMAAVMGGWDRRSQDWNFQLQTATKELVQIQSQIDAATVRVQIAQDDLLNQQLQIGNAQAVLDFLNGKYTNQELYGWMISQISAIYFQCYQMAYGLAKRAESCLRFELGLTTSDFIQFGYWDSLRRGLMAGERLYGDLKRMEMAYIDQNNREYEIAKYISLVLFDPLALITLKETGQCVVSIPEALLDMDYPGQYMRRIKSVSLTIPCVTGPYTSLNCKLTLSSSRIRVDSVANSPQDYGQDSHFVSNFAATQSIATSSGQNDSGMFELNFRDERYLPFEGAGVISQWLIELPQDCNSFDFETISDVVINLKYTARDGGDALRAVAKQAAVLPGPAGQGINSTNGSVFPNQSNLVRFFSLRHEFPTEWYKFLNPLGSDIAQSMILALTKERFPFQYRGKKIAVSRIDLLLKFKDIHDKNRFRTGTPLGDFVAGQGGPGSLNVYVTPGTFVVGQQPQAPAQPPQSFKPITLTSTATNFNGTPYGTSSVLFNLGYCWLQVFADSIGSVPASLLDSNNHLIPSIVEDIFMACHYSAA